ncbi:MAG: 2-oxo acid dehydrogenase subunit E2 [Kiritimatiellae bacterium]|nr:2-oxo acid dehydrogenase subunit E2 [Kiritimatiellia bacterium]
MEINLKMPDLGTTESEIKIIRWLVEIGSRVERGQPLLEVETDKAVMEVESITGGVLEKVFITADQTAEAGQTLAIIETESGTAVTGESALPPSAPVPSRPGGMFARNREKQAPVAAASTTTPGAGIPLSPARRAAVRRLQQSKQTVPHFYLQTSANAEPMIARRQADGGKTVWDAFFVFAAAMALKQFDQMRQRYEDDHLVPQDTDAIGVAVDIAGDLFVVPIQGAAAKTPEKISGEIRSYAAKIKSGDAEARHLRPTVMTVTNLGAQNVESFAAIVNPPEAAILAVGRVMATPSVRNGQVIVQNRVRLTLSVDHRVINGKYAASFLSAIVEELEKIQPTGSNS